MVNENDESNAVDSKMNSDVSAGCCKPFFFHRALVPCRNWKWCMLHKTICNDIFFSAIQRLLLRYVSAIFSVVFFWISSATLRTIFNAGSTQDLKRAKNRHWKWSGRVITSPWDRLIDGLSFVDVVKTNCPFLGRIAALLNTLAWSLRNLKDAKKCGDSHLLRAVLYQKGRQLRLSQKVTLKAKRKNVWHKRKRRNLKKCGSY